MAEISETITTFDSSDGLKVFYRVYQAENERGRIVVAHGLGEHSGRYANVVNWLVPKGFSIWALDLRGHGQSAGIRGHVSRFDEYIEDLKTFIKIAKEGMPDAMKCFLLGHSMGGLIVLRFALRFPDIIDWVIASSPAFGLPKEPPAIKVTLGKIMSLIKPTLSFGNELDKTKISHDEAVVRAYQNDPLVHDRITARWSTEFFSAMESTNRQASAMKVPTLIQAAGDDHLVSTDATHSFFEKLTLADKTLHIYDGLYHEIYNEPENQRERVLGDLATWLEAHV
jgi:alpha-beta hydrolase superfamily lysophospholipase